MSEQVRASQPIPSGARDPSREEMTEASWRDGLLLEGVSGPTSLACEYDLEVGLFRSFCESALGAVKHNDFDFFRIFGACFLT